MDKERRGDNFEFFLNVSTQKRKELRRQQQLILNAFTFSSKTLLFFLVGAQPIDEIVPTPGLAYAKLAAVKLGMHREEDGEANPSIFFLFFLVMLGVGKGHNDFLCESRPMLMVTWSHIRSEIRCGPSDQKLAT